MEMRHRIGRRITLLELRMEMEVSLLEEKERERKELQRGQEWRR